MYYTNNPVSSSNNNKIKFQKLRVIRSSQTHVGQPKICSETSNYVLVNYWEIMYEIWGFHGDDNYWGFNLLGYDTVPLGKTLPYSWSTSSKNG